MRYLVAPFEPWHMRVLTSEEGTAPVFADPRVYEGLVQENSWTLLTSEGDPVGSGGTIEQWRGRHTAWMYLSSRSSECMLRVTRLVKQFLEPVKGRVEATVRKDFEAGHRWIEMLGFEVETPILRAYGPEGEDHVGYVRLQ